MASLTLVIKTNKDTAEMAKVGQPVQNMQRICNLLNGLKAGALQGTVTASYSSADPVAASGTITLASCATDTVTIGGVTFTGSSTPTGDEQFETDGDDTADAAALAAKINAHPTLSKVVSATSALGVVTVTCLLKGVVGNFITLAETGSTITISGSTLAGGTGGQGSSPLTIGR